MRGGERHLQQEVADYLHHSGGTLGDCAAERVQPHHFVGEGVADAAATGQRTGTQAEGNNDGAQQHPAPGEGLNQRRIHDAFAQQRPQQQVQIAGLQAV